MFNGQPVTYTIKSIQHDDIEGEKGTEQKVVLTFQETPFEHVLPKINAVAIKAMFGPQVQEWIGKRVTLYGTTAIMPFPKKKDEPCIRVFGSPDIRADVRCEWTPPRRKVVVQILKPVQSAVLIAALAAIDAAPDAVALEKFTTRADTLLQEGKINDAEHTEITAAIQRRRTEPPAPEPDVSVPAADPAADSVPATAPVPTLDPTALKLRERQQLIRTINALTSERKDVLISALKEQFEFSSESPVSGQLSTQAHANFITSFISSQ
jgi:hypothetical protein